MLPHLDKKYMERQEPFVSIEHEMGKVFRHTHPEFVQNGESEDDEQEDSDRG